MWLCDLRKNVATWVKKLFHFWFNYIFTILTFSVQNLHIFIKKKKVNNFSGSRSYSIIFLWSHSIVFTSYTCYLKLYNLHFCRLGCYPLFIFLFGENINLIVTKVFPHNMTFLISWWISKFVPNFNKTLQNAIFFSSVFWCVTI